MAERDEHASTGTQAYSARTGPATPATPVLTASPDAPGTGLALAPGARINHYELIREIGRGGMGVVYAARDVKLGRRVAMKFLLHASREVADRFLVEARATAQCSHDHIVIIHEVDEVEGTPFMVLEYLDGKSLRDLMGEPDSGRRLPAARVVELILPVARALARAHELGVVHRDLKPENVFVTDAGQVKVLDFGIAKALGSDDARRNPAPPAELAGDSLRLTRDGQMIGTLPYMSPEQIGVDEIDHRSDLWAIGVMMFEMLAGRHPVTPMTSEAVIENLLDPAPMPPVTAVAPDTPEALADAVARCLQKAKHARLSAQELSEWLEDLLPGRRRRGRSLVQDENPYPGLTAFQEADADRFFGRDRDIARMTARIRELPLTAIVGPSGVGKSSFIRAGVGPALKASGESWDILTVRPGRNPMAVLAGIVQRLGTRSSPAFEPELLEVQALLERLYREPGYLGAVLRRRAGSHGNILLFVDQFEELYTLVPAVRERQAFTAALAGVADDPAAPLRVVVSMRSDFLDRVSEDARFLEELSRGLVFLAPPDREGLRAALVQPVEMIGYRYETSAMVGEMLDALAGTPGALPLLQFAAAKLWDARDRATKQLTVASYHAIGGISGALAAHADEVVAEMNAEAQRLTQRVFRQLVTPERTRAIVELADLHALSGDRDEIMRVIDQLVAARLLVVQTRGGDQGGTVELVHESLIDRWPALRRWLDEDQEDAAFVAQVTAAAKQWDAKGRPAGLLWRGDALEEARRWYLHRPRALPARDRAFLESAFGLARRGKRARRVALIASFVVLGAVAAGASVAYVRVRAAEQAASDNAEAARAKEAEARDALAAMQEKEAQRRAAEDRAQLADTSRQLAEDQVKKTSDDLELSREELQVKNAQLQTALDQARGAKERAERATADAKQANLELKQASHKLEELLKIERQRVKALQDEKLSRTLKD